MANHHSPDSSPTLVLLVEDEALIAMDQRFTLERNGFEVRVAATGEEAVAAAIADPHIALILMDIDLGSGMDGTEAAQQILAAREAPIVFLTSHDEREMVERVRGITRYGYVMKNSGEFVLLQSIAMALELFQTHQEMAEEIRTRRETEGELRNRNKFIEAIVDNLPIGLAVNEIKETTALYMNQKFREIYGWSEADMSDIKMFFHRVYPDPEYRQQIAGRILADISSGDPERMQWSEIEITRKNGTKALVSAKNIPLPDQNLMISTVQDETAHVNAVRSLRESEARLRVLSKHFPHGLIALFDTDLRYTFVSGKILDEGPLSAQDFIGHRLRDIFPKEVADRDEPHLIAALQGETSDVIVPHEGKTHRVTTTPVHDEEHKIIGGLVLTQDITEITKTSTALHTAVQKLELAIEAAEVGVWTFDLPSSQLDWNERMYAIYGIEPVGAPITMDQWWDRVHSDDYERAFAEMSRVANGESVHSVRFRVRRPDGQVRSILAASRPLFENDKIVSFVGFNVDETERLQIQQSLEEAISGRDIAIAETNHRIKNNLLTVSSLIQFAEAETGISLEKVRGQLDAIRRVHELTLDSAGISAFDAGTYIRGIVDTATTAVAGNGVDVSVHIADLTLDPRSAVPAGLIVNELVTNAVRHGVTGSNKESGIRVSVTRKGETYTIEVANTGIPFPADVDMENPTSIGLRLVRALAAQLGGSLSLHRNGETRFVVSFPVDT